MWKWLKRLFEKWLSKEDKKEPTANEEALDINKIKWLGPSYAGSQRSALLKGADMDRHFLTLHNPAPHRWPKKTVKVSVQGIICIFYKRSGELVGGKFDWLRPGQVRKTLENLYDSYNGHTLPEAGTDCYTMFVSVDGAYRSNIVKIERS